MLTNTCFIRHYPNQHHATLPNIILIQKTSAEARILCRMPFLTQPSPFPGLELAPPMASIMVEAGDYRLFENKTIIKSDLAEDHFFTNCIEMCQNAQIRKNSPPNTHSFVQRYLCTTCHFDKSQIPIEVGLKNIFVTV
jgi:hypothetical protein